MRYYRRRFRPVLFAAIAFFILIIFFQNLAYAQKVQFNPKGLSGWAGVGFANFVVKEPQNNFRLDRAQFATLGGEKGFGAMNAYLTFGFSYLSATGQTNYSYTTLSSESYAVSDANFSAQLFQASLGLKIKLIDEGWFKPYVEGGGMYGFYNIKYEFTSTQRSTLTSLGSNHKSEDAAVDLGHYFEGGLELLFSSSFGLKTSVRILRSETKEVETIARKKINYETEVFYVGLLKSF